MAIFIFLHFFAALLYRLSRGDSIPIVKYPPKKIETSSAVAPMAKLDQILPCTSESHPHPPIRSLARAMGVTMGEPQNFADSIAVVLVPTVHCLVDGAGNIITEHSLSLSSLSS